MRRIIAEAMLLIFCAVSNGQNTPRARDFVEICDSLEQRLNGHIHAESEVNLRRVICREKQVDFYFDDELSYYPWREDDVRWFREELTLELQSKCAGYTLGRIYTQDAELSKWILPRITHDGSPLPNAWVTQDIRLSDRNRFINRELSEHYSLGLGDRYIALWQSHGRYFSEKDSLWHWQRAMLHRTVEDLFTQSFVLPYLIPMLENAGAYVMTPRERDTQIHEIICDADRHFQDDGSKNCRTHGSYSERGIWSDGAPGFADTKRLYSLGDNPFAGGRFRQSPCKTEADASAIWTPDIPEAGRYAVYISYASLPESSEAARYTVHHLGGDSHFLVNQRIGGNTWIYLGTFFFDAGKEGYVTLDNSGNVGAIVTADAAKFGGGYGKVERCGHNSGLPAYQEGALYSMPWFGADSIIYSERPSDYLNDIRCRGNWVKWMMEEKGIPFDVSLAFHSDAGFRQNDSIVGTLAIHCLYNESERQYSSGGDRMSGRLLADFVQTQVTDDIRSGFDSLWNRRGLWNKNYAECRTQEIPSMILELLSHQNLTDMEYGHDPDFKFTACRAIYKGILKFLSAIHSCQYEVQPLPVRSFSALLDADRVTLSWKPTADTLEPTAVSKRYIVYSRMDGGAFNEGYVVTDTTYTRKIKPGHIYSFRVEACNDGGRSFPSEILSVGIPSHESSSVGSVTRNRPVLIVNNFTRLSAPASIDGPDYGGFFATADSGVPYIQDISYIGENYEFDKNIQWVSDDEPGFGATHPGYGALTVAGNTFDFPYEHGRDLMQLDLAFCSMSSEAFADHTPDAGGFIGMDLICGKQKSTATGNGRMPRRHPVFTEKMKSALKSWTSQGGNILISGCAIASDSSVKASFTSSVMGYIKASSNASGAGLMKTVRGSGLSGDFRFYTSPNPIRYCIEAPDGLSPTSKYSKVILKYPDTDIPAAILYNNGKQNILAVGVPIECIIDQTQRRALMRKAFMD